MSKIVRLSDLEFGIRTIGDLLPDLTTKQIQEWKALLDTAILKTEKEMCATKLHTCHICFFQEYGYRDELPIAWHGIEDVEACFSHEYEDLKKYIDEQEAAEPFPSPTVTKPDNTLEELLELL